MTQIVVGVRSQPIVSVQEGDEGMGLLAASHLDHLRKHTNLNHLQPGYLQTIYPLVIKKRLN